MFLSRIIERYIDFKERHWGDFVGFRLLLLGTALVVGGCLMKVKFPTVSFEAVEHLGESLVLAGTIAMKLRPNPTPNGNGKPIDGPAK